MSSSVIERHDYRFLAALSFPHLSEVGMNLRSIRILQSIVLVCAAGVLGQAQTDSHARSGAESCETESASAVLCQGED